VLIDKEILVSMDGKARALDNVFVERFWRTIKYEDIYLKEYKDGKALFEGLLSYIQFYNFERKHQSLLYLTPNQVFNERLPITKNSTILTKP
jgi:putative transposase